MPMKSYPHLQTPPENETEWLSALVALARYLRTPEGCPWDREQKTADFAGFLRGEVDELIEAAASNDDAHVREEFGDCLFTLLATAAAAEEEGRFTLEDALSEIHAKMIRRHEHVFGDAKAETAEDAVRVWEEAKRKEKESVDS